jgi:hypothetical protein
MSIELFDEAHGRPFSLVNLGAMLNNDSSRLHGPTAKQIEYETKGAVHTTG